jgi:hypothetical protein
MRDREDIATISSSRRIAMSMRGCSFVISVLFLFSASLIRASSSNFSSHDYPVGHAPILTVAHDFNGDGNIDPAILNNGSGNVGVLLGNGDGTFQPAKNFDVGGTNPSSISVADINGEDIRGISSCSMC